MRLRLALSFAVVACLASLPSPAQAVNGAPGGTTVGQEAPPPGTPSAHKFPMAAEEFRRHIAHHERHLERKLEEYISSSQVPPEQAGAMREQFRAGVAQVDAKVSEVCADGTVTKEEAVAVHHLAKELLRQGGEPTR